MTKCTPMNRLRAIGHYTATRIVARPNQDACCLMLAWLVVPILTWLLAMIFTSMMMIKYEVFTSVCAPCAPTGVPDVRQSTTPRGVGPVHHLAAPRRHLGAFQPTQNPSRRPCAARAFPALNLVLTLVQDSYALIQLAVALIAVYASKLQSWPSRPLLIARTAFILRIKLIQLYFLLFYCKARDS